MDDVDDVDVVAECVTKDKLLISDGFFFWYRFRVGWPINKQQLPSSSGSSCASCAASCAASASSGCQTSPCANWCKFSTWTLTLTCLAATKPPMIQSADLCSSLIAGCHSIVNVLIRLLIPVPVPCRQLRWLISRRMNGGHSFLHGDTTAWKSQW